MSVVTRLRNPFIEEETPAQKLDNLPRVTQLMREPGITLLALALNSKPSSSSKVLGALSMYWTQRPWLLILQ